LIPEKLRIGNFLKKDHKLLRIKENKGNKKIKKLIDQKVSFG
jgi:hypothetical protein